METLGFTDLHQNLSVFAAVLEQWIPVAVGLGAFVGLCLMFAVSFIRARH